MALADPRQSIAEPIQRTRPGMYQRLRPEAATLPFLSASGRCHPSKDGLELFSAVRLISATRCLLCGAPIFFPALPTSPETLPPAFGPPWSRA